MELSRETTAYHEAGHALVTFVQGGRLGTVSIELDLPSWSPQSRSDADYIKAFDHATANATAGHVKSKFRKSTPMKDYIPKIIKTNLAGVIAERDYAGGIALQGVRTDLNAVETLRDRQYR
jgi:hypothetical protein